MAQLQHNIPQPHGHHVQRSLITLHRSPSAVHEHRRLNGNRRRVFEKKLTALQKLKDEHDQHPAVPSSSSFLRDHNFHVRLARVWITCTYNLFHGYHKLDSPGKLFEAQLADQSRHALAQKRIAERLKQADRPAPHSGRNPSNFQSTRKILKPTQQKSELGGLGDQVKNVLPVMSCIKSWLQQPFLHLAQMASTKVAGRHASPEDVSVAATTPLVDSL